MSDPNKVIYFGETDARNSRIRFGIKQKDRSRHVYVIGKTGMGKSTLLENMAVQDIQNGDGICFIDPHGKTAELLLEYIPSERVNDVLYLAPFDMEHPVSFNIMEDVGYDKRHLVVSGLMGAFKKIWKDAWSARMEYILSNTLFALLEYPGSTLLSVNKMLSDKAFRKKVVDNITDSAVKSFWVDEFANYTERMAAEAVPAIQNKVGQFTSNPLVRNIIGQPNSSFDIRKLMDEKKIFIINLSKGRIGESNANLLGSLLITKLYLAAMSRADVPHREAELLPEFNLFVDEFQSFANESFAGILSEARKYKLSLHIAHQYIEQMEDEVKAAVFGNVGTMVSFRVGSYDAEVLEKEFAPVFLQQDIVNLGFAQIYLRLMIDGIGSKPFSAKTIPPLAKPEQDFVAEVIEASRKQFSRPRAEVEELVKTLVNMGKEERPAGQGAGDRGDRRDGDRPRNDSRPREQGNRDRSEGGSARNDRGESGRRDSGERRSEVRSDSRSDSRSDTRPERRPAEDRPERKHEDRPERPERSPRREESSDTRPRTEGKPAISKDKEMELKRQLEEAKRKAIDEEVPDAIQEPEFVSLKTVASTGKKELSKENKNMLKDALLKVLQQNGAPAQKAEMRHQEVKTTSVDSIEVTVETPAQPENVSESKKENPAQQKSAPAPEQDEPAFSHGPEVREPIKPGEIPEDELKRLLEVK
jgi:hypothetical protein